MNLEPLYEEAIQFNNFNGTVLAAGKVEVWYLGRTRKADIYSDVAGETPLPNPFDLNNLGMQQVYVNPEFNYTLVVYDQYGAELFSVDKYLQGAGAHTTSNVVVQPSENIGVSAWTVGEVQIYQPYLIGDVGKTYEGISPIVVNNDEDKISANHVALGLQEPLFFVQDDEEACIIGCSAQTEIPSSVSSKWEDASDSVINNSAQWGIGTVYSPGNYINIQDDVISVTGLQPAGDYAYNSAVSSKLDTTAFSTVSGDFLTAVDLTPYQEKSAMSGYLTTADSAQFYTNDNPSGFITGVDLSDYATTGDLANKLDTTAFSNVSGDFITALPEDLVYTGDLSNYATKDFVNDNIDSATSGLLPTSSFSSVSGGFLTALPSDLVYTADITGFATTAQLSEKLDSTAFSTVSGDFLTAHQDLSDYQTISGMTAYQAAGDYYSASNPSSFVTSGQLSTVSGEITAMIPTALTGDYLDKASADTLYYGINNPSGFITGVDLTPYQTTADMTAYAQKSALDDKLDASAFSTVSSTFLTAVPAGYATENWVTSQGYLTAETDWTNTIQAASANAYNQATAAIPTGLATTGDLQTVSGEITALIPSTAGLATTGDVNDLAISISETYQVKGDYLTTADSANFYTTANESGFITGIPSEVTAAASAVSSNSANWNSTYNTVSANSGDWSVSEEISGTNGIKISESGDKVIIEVSANYATTADLTSKLDTTAFSTVSGNFLTALPADLVYTADIQDMATTGDLTGYQVAGDYYSASNPSGFITGINYNTGSI